MSIIKRFWYLSFGILSLCGLCGLNSVYNQYHYIKPECVAISLALPFAFIFHKMLHWVIWGKI